MVLVVLSLSTPWIPFRLLLFGSALSAQDFPLTLQGCIQPTTSPKFRSAREKKPHSVDLFYLRNLFEKKKRKKHEKGSVLPVDEVPPGVGRRGAVGFLEEKSEIGAPFQWPGGVKDPRIPPFPPAFTACAGSVENGHCDHFDLWTYPLFHTHIAAFYCKWAQTFSLRFHFTFKLPTGDFIYQLLT